MENLQNTEKQEKGLLLKGTLILTFLGELFWIIISGVSISQPDEFPSDELEAILFDYSFFVVLVVGIFSFFAIYTTSKMKRKGAYCLLGVYIIDFIIFCFWSYIAIHIKKYEILIVLSALISLLFASIVWKKMKKMN